MANENGILPGGRVQRVTESSGPVPGAGQVVVNMPNPYGYKPDKGKPDLGPSKGRNDD